LIGCVNDRTPEGLMELVSALRQLWRAKLAVIAAALIALLLALMVTYKITPPSTFQSRARQLGIASATALIDTPSSQVVDLGGATGSDPGSLAARASLLASLLTSSPLKEEIATSARINPSLLIATSVDPEGGAAAAATAPAVSGATVTAADPRANILTASIPNIQSGKVPIIVINTQAPTAAGAARLANQAIEVLKKHVASVALSQQVPGARRLVVTQLGPAQAETVTRGPSRVIAGFVFFLVFGMGCGAILAAAWLRRTWRRAAEIERLRGERGFESLAWDPEPADVDDEDPIPELRSEPSRRPRPAPDVLAAEPDPVERGSLEDSDERHSRDWMSAP
jgi:capsular polysaccharide biosynthesis protein